jgi:hypothetical protein
MTPNKIILHHSGGTDGPEANTPGIRKWHMGTFPNGPADGPYLDIAYHALIENVNGSYEVIIGRPWTWNGAHTVGQNDRAIGVCFIGNYNDSPLPDAMLRVGARFVAWLCRLMGIPETEVYAHRQFANTDCPGDCFDMERFRMMVKDY